MGCMASGIENNYFLYSATILCNTLSTFRLPSAKQILSCACHLPGPWCHLQSYCSCMLLLHPKVYELAICLCWISWSLWSPSLHLSFWIVALTSKNQMFPRLSFLTYWRFVLNNHSHHWQRFIDSFSWFISLRISSWETVPQTGCLLDLELLALILICTASFSSTLQFTHPAHLHPIWLQGDFVKSSTKIKKISSSAFSPPAPWSTEAVQSSQKEIRLVKCSLLFVVLWWLFTVPCCP